jgi:hypothetical protein
VEDTKKIACVGPDGPKKYWIVLLRSLTILARVIWGVARVLKGHISKNCIVIFIDDILIYSNIEEDHGPHICSLIETF